MNEPTHSLQDFLNETAERDRPGDVFELESPKMLEAHVNGLMWSQVGRDDRLPGQPDFQTRKRLLEKGLGTALMKMVSGEMAPLTKIEGQGICYLADNAKNVTILRLQGETINVNGNDLLAFESSVAYEITMHRRIAGMLSGGLFSVKLSGSGMVAMMSHGKPLTLRVTPNDPVSTDPNATVAWSGNLSPEIKIDASFKTLIGRGGGETFQMVFRGDGFVVMQPFEESPIVSATSSL